MPFLGNTPANTFVSIAKQTITGNGGTSYALSYPVTNGNEIDVFVNNVRQEPTAAYTASGSTITFTEAITVSDSVYVIFNGQAVGTIDAPAGAYLPTTGGTINGSVGVKVNADSGTPLLIGRVDSANEGGEIGLCRSSDNLKTWAIDVYGNTTTPSLRIIDNIAGAVRLNIDGSGRVTTPQQPAFWARKDDGNHTGNSVVIWNTAFLNRGNNYNTSTGRFTAPVAGVYCFFYRMRQSGATGLNILWEKNDVAHQWQGTTNGDGHTAFGNIVIQLAVNDTIRVVKYDGTMQGVADYHNLFSGYLLG